MAFEDTPFQSDNSVTDDAKQVASHAGERAQDVAGTAAQEAGAVKDTALSAGGDVVDSVKQQAGNVVEEAKLQTRRLVDEGMDQVRTQAGEGQSQLAQVVRSLSGELDSMVKGTDEEGPMVSLVDNARGYGHQIASWLEDNDPDQLVTSVRRFAARNPWTYLAAAAGVGFVGARLVRGLAENKADKDKRPALETREQYQEPVQNRSYGQAAAPLAGGYSEPYSAVGQNQPGYDDPQPLTVPGVTGTPAPASEPYGQQAPGAAYPDYSQGQSYSQTQPYSQAEPFTQGESQGQDYSQSWTQTDYPQAEPLGDYPQGEEYGQPQSYNQQQPWDQR